MADYYIPTSTCLDLTISFPTNSSSPFPSSAGARKRNIDINEVPKREDEWRITTRDSMEEEEEEEQFDEEGEFPTNNGGLPRKKLRLTKEQSHLLEDSFHHNHTLNPKQKDGLARQLNLKPRQVEVWFQNRRARSKLKQTEIECEYLRRWFGSLTEQNRKLLMEVEELRALKVGPPTIMSPHSCEPLPVSTLTMCPRCERVTTTTGHGGSSRIAGVNSNNNNAGLSAKVPFLHSRHSSAAC